ncbi:MAG: hypothetical protein LRZ85_01625 [Alphaproteobacteria bacterium]|nr:hypothetical protein [Alphaproteobacteria bacterium]MCD8520029.1 hypothetical protein [Alphaproteobacteria bacterium]MCD8526257.1 hypothetical protein [Alphaproteobacteria bacterium]MCD8570713.1 hypothetical protein [Alphaproteobacteria bacterium]
MSGAWSELCDTVTQAYTGARENSIAFDMFAAEKEMAIALASNGLHTIVQTELKRTGAQISDLTTSTHYADQVARTELTDEQIKALSTAFQDYAITRKRFEDATPHATAAEKTALFSLDGLKARFSSYTDASWEENQVRLSYEGLKAGEFGLAVGANLGTVGTVGTAYIAANAGSEALINVISDYIEKKGIDIQDKAILEQTMKEALSHPDVLYKLKVALGAAAIGGVAAAGSSALISYGLKGKIDDMAGIAAGSLVNRLATSASKEAVDEIVDDGVQIAVKMAALPAQQP